MAHSTAGDRKDILEWIIAADKKIVPIEIINKINDLILDSQKLEKLENKINFLFKLGTRACLRISDWLDKK